MVKKALCRLDDIHWCIECCPSGCPLLGDVGDGKKGCLGYHGRKVDGLTQRYLCQIVDCSANYNRKKREEIRQIIIDLPLGQFKMSEVLLQYKGGKA